MQDIYKHMQDIYTHVQCVIDVCCSVLYFIEILILQVCCVIVFVIAMLHVFLNTHIVCFFC